MSTDTQSGAAPFLTYHEIDLPGRDLSKEFKGHLPYAVREHELRSQIALLHDAGWSGVSVTGALCAKANPGRSVAITFDDGSETDLRAAAPLLQEAGFGATFYVIAGWLDRPTYLSVRQIRELHAAGFEIACHSMNHRYLTGLSDRELEVEIVHSKALLEEMLGQPIHHLSCPGGFWDRRVARCAKQSGYRSVATSRIGRNTQDSDPYRLSRICVFRGMRLDRFKSACEGNGLFVKQAREQISAIPKMLLGPGLYTRLHAALHT